MKKSLISLILGASLALFPLKVNAQSVIQNNKNYSYDVFVSWLGNQGNAYGNNQGINFEVAKIDHLAFYKKGNKYFEVSDSKLGIEKFGYEMKDSVWTFVNYDFKPKKDKFKKEVLDKNSLKLSPLGTEYSKSLVAPEVFDIFEGKEIPDTFRVILFSKPYVFVKRDEDLMGNFVEVEYEPLNYKVYSFDKKYLSGSPKILLEKENDGTYSPAGARASVVYVLFGVKVPFNIQVLEKNSKKDLTVSLLYSE